MIEFKDKEPFYFKRLCESQFNIDYRLFEKFDVEELRSKYNSDQFYKILGVLNNLTMRYEEASVKSPETQRYKNYLTVIKSNIEFLIDQASNPTDLLRYKATLVNYGVVTELKKEFFAVLDYLQEGKKENAEDCFELLHEQISYVLYSSNYSYQQLKSLLYSTSVFIKENKFSKVQFTEISPLIEKILESEGVINVYVEHIKKHSPHSELKPNQIVYKILENLEDHTYLIYMGKFNEYAISSQKNHSVFINSSHMHPETMDFNTLFIAFCVLYELGNQLQGQSRGSAEEKGEGAKPEPALDRQVFGGLVDFGRLQGDHWKATELMNLLNDEGKKVNLKAFLAEYIIDESQKNSQVGILFSPSLNTLPQEVKEGNYITPSKKNE